MTTYETLLDLRNAVLNICPDIDSMPESMNVALVEEGIIRAVDSVLTLIDLKLHDLRHPK